MPITGLNTAVPRQEHDFPPHVNAAALVPTANPERVATNRDKHLRLDSGPGSVFVVARPGRHQRGLGDIERAGSAIGGTLPAALDHSSTAAGSSSGGRWSMNQPFNDSTDSAERSG